MLPSERTILRTIVKKVDYLKIFRRPKHSSMITIEVATSLNVADPIMDIVLSPNDQWRLATKWILKARKPRRLLSNTKYASLCVT